MTHVTPQTMVRQNAEVVEAPLDDGLVMMSIETNTFISLDAIAKFIWKAAKTPVTVEQICEQLLDKYDVDAATCRAETSACLEKLLSHKVLDVIDR